MSTRVKREPLHAARRQHADVLVLGHSLEAAIAATRLVKDGWTVLWPGAPASNERLDASPVPVAPGLAPALARVPHLAKTLVELGVDVEAKRLWRPVTVQLLGTGRRADVPTAPLSALTDSATAIEGLSEEPLRLGYLGRRRARARRAQQAAVKAPGGVAGEVVEAVDRVLGTRSDDWGPAVTIASAPHDVQGGAAGLASLFHKRFSELGGWSHGGGLEQPIEHLKVGWRRVGCTLVGGSTHSARLVIVGLDAAEAEQTLPKKDRALAPRIVLAAEPLCRLSFVVRTRGLPAPLGPVAFIDGEILVERRPLEAGREAVGVYFRSPPGSMAADADRVLDRVREVLPFFERHVAARSGPAVVPGYERVAADRRLRPRWRALQARLPMLDASGLDGASRLGEAVAARAKALARRRDPLK